MLHTCCAPCSAAVIEWMLNNDIRPVVFYFNPNIYPLEEYEIRKGECTRYARSLGLEFIDGEYDHSEWSDCIAGLEDEPERGSRCLECFKIRLLTAAKKAEELGISKFTTTLASSRWKSLEQIAEAGKRAVDKVKTVSFLERNWRKGGLQERRNILLAENDFYNQRYCGCEFSIRKTGVV